jgi:hypothetical protein
MAKLRQQVRTASCACGRVAFEADGAPIVSAVCYCESCQKAGQRLEALPGAARMLEEDGGTSFVLLRKDRVRCMRGQEALREHRLKPDSATRRVVAACCNSAMFLEFQNGHWLSVYARRIPAEDRPPLDMRVMTADRRAGVPFADGLPSYRKHSGRFMWRLLSAWAAMGFRAPKVDYVKGGIDGGG